MSEEENLTTYQKAVLRDQDAQKLFRESKTLGRKIRLLSDSPLCSLYYPGKKALVIDVHGGGFCFKSVLDNDVYCSYISKTFDLAVLNADFTLSYKAPYPQQLVEISGQLLALYRKYPELASELPLYFVGHSSGANLAAALAVRMKDSIRIAGCLLNYPLLDLAMDQSTRPVLPDTFPDFLLKDWITMYCPFPELLSRRDVSPLSMNIAEAASFPPSVITLAKKDRLQDDARNFAELLEEARVPHELLEVEERHGFIERHMRNVYLTPEDPQVVLAKKITDQSFEWLLGRLL
jgi:acetyl esterase